MNETTADKVGMKEKLVHEARNLLTYFVYLSVFFIVFRLYTRLVLAEYQIDYFAYGLTVLKSLALAKVIITGEMLKLGEGFAGRPLIVPTVYKSMVFSGFALAFEIIEHLILGWFHGKNPAEVLSELLEHGWPHFLAMALVVSVAFLPFFAFRELGAVLGEGKLQELFFKRRETATGGG
jgi:hypothetical protein